jgi:transposase
MTTKPDPLLEDIDALKALVLAQRVEIQSHATEVEHLNLIIARLKRMQFGRRSEKLDHEVEQLELRREELQIAQTNSASSKPDTDEKAIPVRRPLPEHLPRENVVHQPDCQCPDCGTAMRQVGEDVAEVLEHVSVHFRVIRHVSPKLACPACERIVQVAAPARPIARGMAGAGIARAHLDLEVCRPFAALPAGPDLRP